MSRKTVTFGAVLPISSTPVDELLDYGKADGEAGFDSSWS